MEELNHRSEGYFQGGEKLKPDVHRAHLHPQVNFNSLDWFGVGREQGLNPTLIKQMKIRTWNLV